MRDSEAPLATGELLQLGVPFFQNDKMTGLESSVIFTELGCLLAEHDQLEDADVGFEFVAFHVNWTL